MMCSPFRISLGVYLLLALGACTSAQKAAVVIGQPDFTSNSESASPTASSVTNPFGNPVVINGALYLPDRANNRVLGFSSIPTTNGASADFVLGQSDFVSASTSSSVGMPLNVATDNASYLFVADMGNKRIAVFNPIPTATNSAPNASNPEQPSWYLTDAGQGGFSAPGVFEGGGALVVADQFNNRVLVWNSIPTGDTAANLVLGQPDFASTNVNQSTTSGEPPTASSLAHPTAAWTDGTQLVVVDSMNSRVLIWKTFPTQNDQPADLVLGQVDFASSALNQSGSVSARTLSMPQYGVYSDGAQLFISDTGNNRVLIWNSFPTQNDQPADAVLGQPNVTLSASATSQSGMSSPAGLYLSGSQLFVADSANNRYLIFNGQ